MKKFVVFLVSVCLSLQGFAAGPTREPSAYNIEKAPFSALILNAEQLGRLTPADRTVYLMNIVALVQMIELSQSRIIKKVARAGDKKKKTAEATDVVPKEPVVVASKSLLWYEVLVQKAEAAIALALKAGAAVASRIGPVFNALGRLRGTMGTGGDLAKAKVLLENALKAGVKAENVFAKSAGAAVNVGSAAVKAARTEMVAGVDAFVSAQKAFQAAKKVAAPDSALFKQSKKAMEVAGGKMLSKVQKFYKADPAQEAAFRVEFREALKKAGSKNPSAIADYSWKTAKAGGTMWTGYEAGKIIESGKIQDFVTGLTDEKVPATPADGGAAPATQTAGIAPGDGEAVGTGAGEPATNGGGTTASTGSGEGAAPAAQKRTRQEGGSCMYGGRPSTWTKQGNAINCPRPAGADCGEPGYFQCQTYGLSVPDVKMAHELCVWPYNTLENLTVRCANALQEVIKTKSPQADAAATEATLAEIKVALQELESNPDMKNEAGQPISIGQYCSVDQKDQVEECKVTREIIASLKSIEALPAAVAQNAADAAAAASAAADEAAKAATRAAGEAVAPDATK